MLALPKYKTHRWRTTTLLSIIARSNILVAKGRRRSRYPECGVHVSSPTRRCLRDGLSSLETMAWVITELLSTPPDDVIQTISSENVRRHPVPTFTLVHATMTHRQWLTSGPV
ncbi:hypothetical protein V8E53_006231 [Lactarius tabidus]